MNPSPHKQVPCISRQMWVYQRLPRIYLSFGVFGLYYGYNENDTGIFNEDASCPGKTLRQGSSEAEAMALVIVRV